MDPDLIFYPETGKDPNQKYWIAVGVSFGLAFLNKYSVLVLGFSIFIALLISEHRKLLFSKYLIYAGLISLLIMSPNIIWQIDHKFAVFTHMGELYRTQLVHVSKQTFLSEQLLLNSTCILIWMAGFLVILFYKSEKQYKVFAYILLMVIFMFLILKGKPYYTLGAYIIMFAFGGYVFEKYFVGKSKIVGYSIIMISLVAGVLFAPIGLPLLPKKQMAEYCVFFSRYISPAPMRSEDNSYYPVPQDYMDMTGWDELAKLASLAYNSLDEDQKKSCIIYTNNYGQAGAIDFYGKKYHLPAPTCMNDSYIFWAPDSLTGSDFIISDSHLGDIPRLFHDYKEIGEINDEYFRENGLKVYLCQNPTPLLNDFFKRRIKANKEVYGY